MKTKELFYARCFQKGDEEPVVNLWKACNLVVPQNDPYLDIEKKMAFQPNLFLLGILEETIIASIMIGYEGHRGWINYLAVAPEHRKQGYGRKLMEIAEIKLKAIGCPKINIQVRTTNKAVIAFYKRIGFLDDRVIGMGKRF